MLLPPFDRGILWSYSKSSFRAALDAPPLVTLPDLALDALRDDGPQSNALGRSLGIPGAFNSSGLSPLSSPCAYVLDLLIQPPSSQSEPDVKTPCLKAHSNGWRPLRVQSAPLIPRALKPFPIGQDLLIESRGFLRRQSHVKTLGWPKPAGRWLP